MQYKCTILCVRLFSYIILTHSLVLSASSGTCGDSKGSPYDSVCCCSGGHVETQFPDIEVFLNGEPPSISWSSPLSLARGVHLWAVLVMEFEGIRLTCPSHRHRRVCIISARVSIPVLFLSSSSEMVLGL